MLVRALNRSVLSTQFSASSSLLAQRVLLGKASVRSFSSAPAPEVAPHFKVTPPTNNVSVHPKGEMVKTQDERDFYLTHPIYTKDEVLSIAYTHREPHGLSDRIAFNAVGLLRFCFDNITGYIPEENEVPRKGIITSERAWMLRFIFLETIAGVPGFMAAMARHLRSLRLLKKDHGWIHTLLEEAENERMHLLTFMKLANPSAITRLFVLAGQGVFVNWFFLAYLVSPGTCHRFVGYIEEEAVRTYTHAIHDIEKEGTALSHWKTLQAPDIAIQYWKLPANATMREVVYAIRADEAQHRDVNHTLGSLKIDDPNPY